MRFKVSLLFMTFAAPVSFAGISTPAGACQPPLCPAETGRWTEARLANPSVIPADGVLVVTGTRWGGGAAEADFAAIEIAVKRDGVAVAGALEGIDLPGAFVWRPAQGLTPGVHEVALSIDNDAIDPGAPDGDCGPATLDNHFSVEVVDETSPAPRAPSLRIDAEVSVEGPPELDDLICCDGAFPYESPGSCDLELSWDEGRCFSLHRDAELRGWFERTDGEPALLAGALIYQLVVDGAVRSHSLDGRLRHSATAPFCAHVEVESLATGAVAATEERCYGQHLAGPLGALKCDPTAELADCTGEPYRCANVGGEWDPQDCSPWSGVVDADAVDCDFDGPTTEGSTTGGESIGDESSGGSSSDGDASSGGASSDEGDSSSGTTDQYEDGEGGCGCDVDAAGAPWLAAVVLLRPRRRRQPQMG